MHYIDFIAFTTSVDVIHEHLAHEINIAQRHWSQASLTTSVTAARQSEYRLSKKKKILLIEERLPSQS